MAEQYFIQQVFSAIGDATVKNTNVRTSMLDSFEGVEGNTLILAGALTTGDVIKITCTGSVTIGIDGTPAARPRVDFDLFFPADEAKLGGLTLVAERGRIGTASIFLEFLLTVRPGRRVAANGFAVIGATRGQVIGGIGPVTGPLDVSRRNGNRIGLAVTLNSSDNNFSVKLDQCVIEHMVAIVFPAADTAEVAAGTINGKVQPDVVPVAATYAGILSGTAIYAGTLYAATAYQDLGSANNTQSVAFTYQGAEGGGGVAVGLRFSQLGQQGNFAFIDTSSSPPVIRLWEMPGAWGAGSSSTSSSLSLTNGNTYELTIDDDGTIITASLVDDLGLQSCTLTPAVPASNTEVMFGWLGLTASYAFSAEITQVATSSPATPAFSPPAATFANGQSVTVSAPNSASSIYYTTDGSTPTYPITGTTQQYAGPITIGSTQTVKAIAALDGWSNSAVAVAAYTIAAWTIEYGTIDGTSSGTFSLVGNDRGMLSASAVYASTLYAAAAYQNIGTSNNMVAVTFTYQGAEGGGGVAVGTRWNDSSQQGDLAFINTNVTPPVIKLQELTSSWSAGTSSSSSSLTLTPGSSYTLVIADNGTNVTASIIDDAGPQNCSITPTLSTANQEVAIGWVGLTASYTFTAAITSVTTSIVATPTFSPAAGTYAAAQSVTIATTTSGATIYYTTDGSTPTTSSTPYTGAVS